MGLSETTLPEALKSEGYRSQFVGKWHLMPIGAEDFEQHYPTAHGFDQNIAGREWGQPKGPGKYFSPFGMPNLDDGNKGDFLDRLCSDGLKFSQAYSACTVCSPSRAAILLGKYPARTNLTIDGHAPLRNSDPILFVFLLQLR